jgi:hypothetical protein
MIRSNGLVRTLLAAAAGSFLMAAASLNANASVIFAPAAPYIPFAQLEQFTAGPITVAPGITWTSTNASTQGGSVYGYTFGYGFGSNGFDTENMVGLNDSTDAYTLPQPDSMTFAFATPVSSVGGYIDWVPNNLPVTIGVYDSSDTLIEDLVVSQGDANLATPNSFYGFQETTADISYFTLTDGYIGILSGLNGNVITGTSSSVPEPFTLSLFGAGLAGAAAMRRRKKKARI